MNKTTILLASLGAALALGGCSSTGMRADSMGISSTQSAPDSRIGDSKVYAGSYPASYSDTRTMGAPGPMMVTPDTRATSLAPGRN